MNGKRRMAVALRISKSPLFVRKVHPLNMFVLLINFEPQLTRLLDVGDLGRGESKGSPQ